MNPHRVRGRLALLVVLLAAACSRPPQPEAPAPLADPAAAARADSIARARADSLERARADSIAMAARADRAEAVREEVTREDTGPATPATASGLSPEDEARLIEQIYFDFDRSEIRPDQASKAEAKLAVLRANQRLEVLIEGHCDERGSDEYNLALGMRRAASVKRYLVEHGVAESRISVVSFGEERPADPGSNEEGWALNRRAEFRVTRSAR